MAGSSLACALATAEVPCTLIESQTTTVQRKRPGRAISLSRSSQHILSELGLWTDVHTMAYPIERLHISARQQFGALRLKAEDFDIDTFGHVTDSETLENSLRARLGSLPAVEVLDACDMESVHAETTCMKLRVQNRRSGDTHTVQCQLLIAADGSDSRIRQQLGIPTQVEDYQQHAIFTTITTQQPNRHTAYERFTHHGPVALLPRAAQTSTLIYTVPASEDRHYLDMPEAEFLQRLEVIFGPRLGAIRQLDERNGWPLRYVRSRKQVASRLVLLGNAAYSIHPHAAQGFNLSLRDAVTLATMLIRAKRQHLAVHDPQVLQRYAAARRTDQNRIIRFNRLLSSLFYSSRLPHRLLRNTVMLCLAHVPEAQGLLIDMLSGPQMRPAYPV